MRDDSCISILNKKLSVVCTFLVLLNHFCQENVVVKRFIYLFFASKDFADVYVIRKADVLAFPIQ